jgi:hypothetical protein
MCKGERIEDGKEKEKKERRMGEGDGRRERGLKGKNGGREVGRMDTLAPIHSLGKMNGEGTKIGRRFIFSL